MENRKIIHLEEPNTLSNFLTKEERENIVSLKITGFMGRKDFEDVLDDMCDTFGEYDDDDDYTPDYELSPSLRHLDMGEATYVDGDCLPYFGFHTLLETAILPQGIKSTLEDGETALSEAENLHTLVLPSGLKTVGGFNSCPKLTGLILPKGLEVIGSHAFCGCDSITSIRIPASVKEMYGSSFAGCNITAYEVDDCNPYYTAVEGVVYSKDLQTLVAFPTDYPIKHYKVPAGTKRIGSEAFMFSHVDTVELPQGLTTIEYGAFECSDILSIEIPDSVIKVEEMAFSFCTKLKHKVISKGLKEIPQQMIESCSELKILEIPSNVKVVHYSALAWSRDLERLILHDGLEEIADDGVLMTYEGQLREVFLPKTLKKVPGGVFNYSPFIKSFQLNPANPYFSVVDGALCSKDKKVLYSVPDYNRTSCKVPEGIEVIEEKIFAFLPKLHTIELPSTLRVIKARAFQGCKSLRKIEIPAGVEKVDIGALWADNLKTVVMESPDPPEMTGNVKDDDWRYKETTLLVPPDAVATYKEAPGWKCFIVKQKSN